MPHPGPPANRPRDKRRVQGAPEQMHRGAPCHCTGERPATAQGSALATAQGSALALSIRSAATSHRHGLRASAGRERAATVPAPTAASVSKLFRNQAFRERLNTFGVLKFFRTPPAQGSALPYHSRGERPLANRRRSAEPQDAGASARWRPRRAGRVPRVSRDTSRREPQQQSKQGNDCKEPTIINDGRRSDRRILHSVAFLFATRKASAHKSVLA